MLSARWLLLRSPPPRISRWNGRALMEATASRATALTSDRQQQPFHDHDRDKQRDRRKIDAVKGRQVFADAAQRGLGNPGKKVIELFNERLAVVHDLEINQPAEYDIGNHQP